MQEDFLTFLQLEEEMGLFDVKIRDIAFWQYIRWSVYDYLLKNKYKISEAHTTWTHNSRVGKLKIPFLLLKNALGKHSGLFLKEKDVLIFNHPRKVKNEDGQYYCPYTDLFAAALPQSSCSMEVPSVTFEHCTPSVNENLFYLDDMLLRRLVARKLHKVSLTEDELALVKKIAANLHTRLGMNFENILIQQITTLIFNIHFFDQAFEKMLLKIKPKAILEVVYYNPTIMLLNRVAKRLKIPVIEIQHGVIGQYHLAYNTFYDGELESFPNYIFLFGDLWKDNIQVPLPQECLIPTGFPYFEKQVQKYQGLQESEEKKIILFLSQGTIGKELSKLACELNQRINHAEYKIIYKLHPGEYARWKTEYPWLLDAEIEVIDHYVRDLYYYFGQATYQVGVYSTALYEGLGFGLKTFIYQIYGHHYVDNLYQNGFAQLVTSVDEVLSGLGDKMIVPEKASQVLWERGALQRIIAGLQDVLKKQAE